MEFEAKYKEFRLQITSFYSICLLGLCKRTADKKASAHVATLETSQPNQATGMLSVLSLNAKGAGAICGGTGGGKTKNGLESKRRREDTL